MWICVVEIIFLFCIFFKKKGGCMDKVKLSSTLSLLFFFAATPVYASNSLSVNYAMGKESGAQSMHGLNFIYKHDITDFSLIASGTYMQNTEGNENLYVKNKYASIMPGVAINITDNLSFYGSTGLSCGSKMKQDQSHEIYGVAFGSGLLYQINGSVQVNSGYELGIVEGKEINTFILGAGFVF